MKRLNGNDVVNWPVMADIEATFAEAEHIISAPTQLEQQARLCDLLREKTPQNAMVHDFQLQEFRKSYGTALVTRRERELKQLPEKT